LRKIEADRLNPKRVAAPSGTGSSRKEPSRREERRLPQLKERQKEGEAEGRKCSVENRSGPNLKRGKDKPAKRRESLSERRGLGRGKNSPGFYSAEDIPPFRATCWLRKRGKLRSNGRKKGGKGRHVGGTIEKIKGEPPSFGPISEGLRGMVRGDGAIENQKGQGSWGAKGNLSQQTY